MTSRPSTAAPILAVLSIVLIAVMATAFAASFYHRYETVTLLSLSPDDRWRVHLIERGQPINIDRNFLLRLEQLSDGSIVELFRSPDEGRPIGSERILWSRDSKQFVLVGRHFYVHEGAQLPTGEALYLMYDIPSERLACNAEQQSTHTGFSLSDCPWLTDHP
jgi:hypothetical protein